MNASSELVSVWMMAFAAVPVRIARHGKSARAILLALAGLLAPVPAPASAAHEDFTCGVEYGSARAAAFGVEPVNTLGIQKLLFIRLRFPDDTADPITIGEAETTLRKVDEAFRRMSYGKFGLTSTVSSVVMLSKPRTAYADPGGFDRFIDDARQAAAAAGFDHRDYDLDVVRHSGVPGFMGGNARLGVRGAQVQVGGVVILLHELGHNLGLSHANFWDTSGPGIALGSPPLPSNYESLPDPRSIPIHPESRIDMETVVGPGAVAEYGDLWDIMGSGDSDFSATYKRYLGWLPESSRVIAPPGMSVHRLHGLDVADTGTDLVRCIHVRKPATVVGEPGDYAIELPASRNTLPPVPGVLVRWVDPLDNVSSTRLLDGTPGTPLGNGDAALPIGRTFSDAPSGIHITPVNLHVDGSERWTDVVVHNSRNLTNAVPIATLTASADHVGLNEVVRLTAEATDPDGDELAWYWDFGDGTPSTNSPSIAKSWRRAGDFVVRLEVSDMKGGVARAHVVLRVGDRPALRVSGVVRDGEGNPLAGVRVHNGVISGEQPQTPRVETWTDSDGAYTLAGLEPGTYSVSAFHPEYRFERKPAVTVTDQDATDHDFTGTRHPFVTVSGPAEVPEGIGPTNLFTFTRHGPTDQPLTVIFRLGGTATASSDYIAPLIDRVVIPAGSVSAGLEMPILDDSVGEGDETIAISVAYPVRSARVDDQGNEYFVFYPGWETLIEDGVLYWTRTHPEYTPLAGSTAEVILVDDDETTDHVVTVSGSGLIALEEPLVETTFELTRTGAVSQPLTIDLEFSGSAVPGEDYEPLPKTLTFEANETFKVLTVRPIADDIEEPEETVVLRVVPREGYGVAVDTAEVLIRDRLVYPQDLRISLGADNRISIAMKAQPGSRLVLEGSPDLLEWSPIRTNLLFNTDSAFIDLPNQGSHRFFRTIRENAPTATP